MTELSPAAQAVLDAFGNASDGEYVDGVWVVNERTMLAAAIHAANAATRAIHAANAASVASAAAAAAHHSARANAYTAHHTWQQFNPCGLLEKLIAVN